MNDAPAAPVDLEAYFKRIDWRGSREATLSTLAGILDAHMTHIPFENIDVLLGRAVQLDLPSLQAKLVEARRGGYCFEHSSLLGAVLERSGYSIVRRAARVVLFSGPTEAPRAHMFLTVTLPEGVFVVDPGFGGFGARFPVPLEPKEAPFDSATHWIVRDGNTVTLRFKRGEETIDGWVAALDEVHHPVDFEVGNYFTATNPRSPFKSMLMMSVRTPEGAVNIMNSDVTVRRGDESSVMPLSDRRALRAIVAERFGFDLPEIETLRIPAVPDWNEPG